MGVASDRGGLGNDRGRRRHHPPHLRSVRCGRRRRREHRSRSTSAGTGSLVQGTGLTPRRATFTDPGTASSRAGPRTDAWHRPMTTGDQLDRHPVIRASRRVVTQKIRDSTNLVLEALSVDARLAFRSRNSATTIARGLSAVQRLRFVEFAPDEYTFREVQHYELLLVGRKVHDERHDAAQR